MVTRIKGRNVDQLGRVPGKGKPARSGPRASGSQSSRSDGVHFSSDARTISRADEVIGGAPDVRMDLVEPIREALAGGRYNVSSIDVADKILRQVLMDRKRAV